MRSILFLAALAVGSTAHAGVPVGVNGTWYDPARPGHGFAIEVVDTDTAVAIWHTFDNAGDPLTLYLVGRIEGDSIVADAFAPRGMRFHEFDPADVIEQPWGSVRLDFADCAHATVSYQPSAEGFTSGALPIERLLTQAPAHCALDALGALPEGRYAGFPFAAVQPDGSLLALFGFADGVHEIGGWNRALGKPMVHGVPTREATGLVRVELDRLVNDWLCASEPAACAEDPFPIGPPATLEFQTTTTSAAALVWDEFGEEAQRLTGPSPLQTYSGSNNGAQQHSLQFGVFSGYNAFGVSQFVEYRLDLSGSALCVRRASENACLYTGSIASNGAFQLQASAAGGNTYSGFAYFRPIPFTGQFNLTLLGTAPGGHGLAVCAGAHCGADRR